MGNVIARARMPGIGRQPRNRDDKYSQGISSHDFEEGATLVRSSAQSTAAEVTSDHDTPPKPKYRGFRGLFQRRRPSRNSDKLQVRHKRDGQSTRSDSKQRRSIFTKSKRRNSGHRGKTHQDSTTTPHTPLRRGDEAAGSRQPDNHPSTAQRLDPALAKTDRDADNGATTHGVAQDTASQLPLKLEAVSAAEATDEEGLAEAAAAAAAAAEAKAKEEAEAAEEAAVKYMRWGHPVVLPALVQLQKTIAHPEGGPLVLFIINRSMNSNVVMYRASQDHRGVDVNWIMFEASDNHTEPLTLLEKNTAYGTAVTQIAPEKFTVRLSALRSSPIEVSKLPSGRWVAKATIGGKPDTVLLAVHVEMSKSFIKPVAYIELFGEDGAYEMIEKIQGSGAVAVQKWKAARAEALQAVAAAREAAAHAAAIRARKATAQASGDTMSDDVKALIAAVDATTAAERKARASAAKATTAASEVTVGVAAVRQAQQAAAQARTVATVAAAVAVVALILNFVFWLQSGRPADVCTTVSE